MRTSRSIALSLALLAVVLSGGVWFALGVSPSPARIDAGISGLSMGSDAGYQRVTDPRSFSFPADHGPHQDYQTEWWYYTGNLRTDPGREWGYQLTFFRQSLASTPLSRTSEWATNEVYLAHFTLTDITSGKFYAFERVARGGEIGLAGATGSPYHIFVEGWSAASDGSQVTLSAQAANLTLELKLQAQKPPTLQGNAGLSPKSAVPGKASYYYSLTRMETSGQITLDGQAFAVTGLSWFDHEWATSPLTQQQVGWEWFGLQLDDGRDVMWGQLRRADGSVDWGGGSVTGLKPNDVTILYPGDAVLTPLATWRSPDSGAEYPARWRLQIPKANIELEIEPLVADQELRLQLVTYWEGAVKLSGTSSGRGYAELTGYGGQGAPLR